MEPVIKVGNFNTAQNLENLKVVFFPLKEFNTNI